MKPFHFVAMVACCALSPRGMAQSDAVVLRDCRTITFTIGS